MMIAFAYCNTTPQVSAMYSTLIEGMLTNIAQVMPGHTIAMMTDDKTPIFKGINRVVRIPRVQGLMTWRLKCHQVAHDIDDEILFTEPDVRFRESVLPLFDDKDFEICLTSRENAVALNNEKINTPFTLGMTLSRSAEFWRQAKLHCQTLSEKEQDWFGDMLSVAHVIGRNEYRVKTLDGEIYNHVVNDPAEQSDAKVLHYKGKRKKFLFPFVPEAAEVEP